MRRDDWLLWQLPVGMTDDDFFVRFVTIFQRTADTVFDQIDALPHVFDPTVAPDNMVRQMAQWFGVDWVDSSLDVKRQRELVIGYADLIRWRGTKKGLRMLLALLTKGAVEVEDSGGVFPRDAASGGPPHVRLDVENAGWNKIDDLIRIVRSELPANVTFDLWVGADQVWPRADAAAGQTGHRPGEMATVGAAVGGSVQASTTLGPGADHVAPRGNTPEPTGDVLDAPQPNDDPGGSNG